MEANASRYHGKAPDEIAWTELERQTRAVREYLAAPEAETEPNPDRKPPKVISPSDPCSACGPANIAAVRHYQSRGGVSMSVEQEITSDLGAFVRAGCADGTKEPFEFTDIDRTVAAGLSVSGKFWARPDDAVGVAGVINGITGVHQAFFECGRTRYPRRRRAAAAFRPRTGCRGLLQLHPLVRDESEFRLPVHRQPWVQHPSGPGECLLRPIPHRILIIIIVRRGNLDSRSRQ
jgi:Carbohydrate-selective porin, OprB family